MDVISLISKRLEFSDVPNDMPFIDVMELAPNFLSRFAAMTIEDMASDGCRGIKRVDQGDEKTRSKILHLS